MKITFTEVAWSSHLSFSIYHLFGSRLDSSPKLFSHVRKKLQTKVFNVWSRRINSEHRLVCERSQEELTIISCRFHYQK